MLQRLNFNLWYFVRPPWDSGISPPELFEFISTHPPGKVIDLGCGTGTNVITLAQHGWEVIGIDFAPRAIQIAKKKSKKAGINAIFNTGDVTNLTNITGPFDFALDLGCFHGVGDHPAYLYQLNRILTKGGFWLMYGIFHSSSYSNRPGLTSEDIDLIKSSGFELRSRKDGFDKLDRPSAWFLFRKS
jgi:ubiquinone/menaquinone biosynthesis C-methylase UbiE